MSKSLEESVLRAYVVEAYEEDGLSTREISKRLAEIGVSMGQGMVCRLLKQEGVALRQPARGDGTGRSAHAAGHVRIYVGRGKHHRATQAGYVWEHILVVEEALGRHLAPGEVVHHRNMCRADNSINNLMVVGTKVHRAIHKVLRTLDDDFTTAYRRVTGESSIDVSSFSFLGELKHRLFIDPYIDRIEAGEVDAVIAEIQQLHEQLVEEVTDV